MRVVDLFSGCGGLSLGFQNAGFDIVAAVDNWQPAVNVYRKNFTHPIFGADLSNVEESVKLLSPYKPDMIIGGPPCQDFSQAGKRNEDNGRGDLTVAYAQIIAQMKPKFFLMENVDRIVKTGKFAQAMAIWKEAGYGMTSKLMDSSFCGVPQKRKRFIVLGVLGGQDHEILPFILKRLSVSPTTMRDYFGDELGTEYYYRHPRNYERRGIYGLDEPSATIRGVNRPIPKGYPGHKLDATTDIAKVRPLSTIERGWIQTFPKDFIWEGPKTHVEQLIGNAVPVKLSECIASALKEFLLAQETANEPVHTRIESFKFGYQSAARA